VAYALPSRQAVEEVTAPAGSTAREIIESSSLLREFPEIDLARNSVGVYGRLIDPDRVVEDGDRIEIYRPLVADPKAVRRRRASESKAMTNRRGKQGRRLRRKSTYR
jgi:putative ubiquitin-RnfH superfamily antitoxin RatB of RatAB toxin-antitoxin module